MATNFLLKNRTYIIIYSKITVFCKVEILKLEINPMFFTPPPPPPIKPPVIIVWVHGTATLSGKIPQLISKPGLHHLSEYNQYNYNVTRSEAIKQADSQLFQREHFYLFGWSGKLALQARKIASQELFDGLKQL